MVKAGQAKDTAITCNSKQFLEEAGFEVLDHFYCGMNLIAMKNTRGANSTTTIKRSDFGVDKYVPKVGDEVKIAIQVEATKD
jgi:polyisoprenoid-binding protein YceI